MACFGVFVHPAAAQGQHLRGLLDGNKQDTKEHAHTRSKYWEWLRSASASIKRLIVRSNFIPRNSQAFFRAEGDYDTGRRDPPTPVRHPNSKVGKRTIDIQNTSCNVNNPERYRLLPHVLRTLRPIVVPEGARNVPGVCLSDWLSAAVPFGGKLLGIWLHCPQDGTAALRGLETVPSTREGMGVKAFRYCGVQEPKSEPNSKWFLPTIAPQSCRNYSEICFKPFGIAFNHLAEAGPFRTKQDNTRTHFISKNTPVRHMVRYAMLWCGEVSYSKE